MQTTTSPFETANRARKAAAVLATLTALPTVPTAADLRDWSAALWLAAARAADVRPLSLETIEAVIAMVERRDSLAARHVPACPCCGGEGVVDEQYAICDSRTVECPECSTWPTCCACGERHTPQAERGRESVCSACATDDEWRAYEAEVES